jgi:uncharacterized membrane protein YccC
VPAVSKALRDPVTWTNVAQLLKTAAAVVIAWLIATRVFDIPQPFLAPWAALLTVHATVVGTLRRGVQQIGAAVLGVLLAFGAGALFGTGALSLGIAVALGLAAGTVRGLRAETTTAAATALVVLTTGYSDDGGMLLSRLGDTGIGIAVGLLVNLLVWPPLRDRAAAGHIDAIDDRIGDLLGEIAAGVRAGHPAEAAEAWIGRTGELDDQLDAAWRVLGQARESGRLNPRLAASRRMRAVAGLDDVLARLAQAVAETRSMARTIGLAHTRPNHWHAAFREPWLRLLERTAEAVGGADAATLTAVRADLDAFVGQLDVARLPDGFWPISGALIVNLRNIVEALDVVADAQPVRVPPPALSRAARRARGAPTPSR